MKGKLKHIKLSDLTLVKNPQTTFGLERSQHKANIPVYYKHEKNDEWLFLKSLRRGSAPCELQAAVGDIYRLILLNRSPKVRVVVDEQGRGIGVLTKAYKNFQSIAMLREKTGQLPKERIDQVKYSGLASVLVAAYFLEENDLNDTNYGLVNGQVVKLDHDQSMWSIVGHEFEHEESYAVISTKTRVLEKCIHNFPKFVFMNDWPATDPEFASLYQDRRFKHICYLYFTKIILLPDVLILKTIQQHISNIDSQKRLFNQLLDRKQRINNFLLSDNEYRSYVLLYYHKIIKILSEFEVFNGWHKGQNHNDFKVDLEEACKAHLKLLSEVCVRNQKAACIKKGGKRVLLEKNISLTLKHYLLGLIAKGRLSIHSGSEIELELEGKKKFKVHPVVVELKAICEKMHKSRKSEAEFLYVNILIKLAKFQAHSDYEKSVRQLIVTFLHFIKEQLCDIYQQDKPLVN